MSRYRLYWYQLRHRSGTNYQLVMPMADLYGPAIRSAFPKFKISKWSPYAGRAQSCDITLASEKNVEALDRFLTLLKQAVWIQNPSLDYCMALDFNFTVDETGERQYTDAGHLEYAAKYQSDTKAIGKLLQMLGLFVECNPLYQDLDGVIAVLPSKAKRFHLASVLAEGFAKGLRIPDLSSALRKIKETPEMKNLTLEEKQQVLQGAFQVVETKSVSGRRIVLIDDLYQSGTTMSQVAISVRKARAREILGLCAVKSLRDTDNIPEGSG